jgi:hypothetical protein
VGSSFSFAPHSGSSRPMFACVSARAPKWWRLQITLETPPDGSVRLGAWPTSAWRSTPARAGRAPATPGGGPDSRLSHPGTCTVPTSVGRSSAATRRRQRKARVAALDSPSSGRPSALIRAGSGGPFQWKERQAVRGSTEVCTGAAEGASPARLTPAKWCVPHDDRGLDGRTWDRTRDLSRVKRALSR